jgi:hypothetical protein
MTDEQARDLVLGNWHKLNAFLQTAPALEELRRLLALELARGRDARRNFLEKLRSSVSAARSRLSKASMEVVLGSIEAGEVPRDVFLERVLGYDTWDERSKPPEVIAVRRALEAEAKK